MFFGVKNVIFNLKLFDMILGICGYGYTGSGALISLLKEYDGVSYLYNKGVQEFTLSYISDGLEDLEYNLVSNPSKGTRCDNAIYRFKLLVDFYERNYNRFTKGQFRELSYDFLDELIQVKWKGVRVFEYQRSWKRLFFYFQASVSKVLRRFGINVRLLPLHERYISIFPDNYLNCTRNYLEKVLGGNHEKDCLLLDQPFSIGNPLHSMRFFNNPKCIVVDRDPRDLYVMVKHVYKKNALFIPSDTVENFINYYKRVRDDRLWNDSDLIYRVQFEDLIYKYKETVKGIEEFVGPLLGKHSSMKTLFNPSVSIANTNVYSYYPEDSEAINKISHDLNEYLYSFPDVNIEREKIDLNAFTYM